jgi:cytochrome c553
MAVLHAAAQHPSWAYGFTEPPPPAGAAAAPAAPAPAARGGGAGAPAPAPDPPRTVPGSSRTYTRTQASDDFNPGDWFPDEHPPMPPIVAVGHKEIPIRACAACHYINGQGRQVNAALAGLPYEYFVQTMMDFKNGLRRSADPRKNNTNLMIGFVKAMTDDEITASARYYASIPYKPWIKVMETRTVPKTRVQNGVFIKLEGNETEPIGVRILEMPEFPDRTELLDPHAPLIAYAPVGSLKAGEALVRTGGNGKTIQCSICHGMNLEGSGPVPPIAGRSPSYLVRQLYDMQVGARHGLWTELMKPAVAKLTEEDMVNIAAYVASRPPQTPVRSSAAR